MITKGSKVRIKDNYTGNLDDVKGKVATVQLVSTVVEDNAEKTLYLLDIKGTYKIESSYRKGEFYTYSDKAIVTPDEIEEYSFGMKDCKGVLLEIGDQVVYSGNRPGIIEGEIVDFKETEETLWGAQRIVKKVQLKIAKNTYHDDGGGRRVKAAEHYTQWFEHGTRMMIVQKNLKDMIFTGKPFVLHYGNE